MKCGKGLQGLGAGRVGLRAGRMGGMNGRWEGRVDVGCKGRVRFDAKGRPGGGGDGRLEGREWSWLRTGVKHWLGARGKSLHVSRRKCVLGDRRKDWFRRGIGRERRERASAQRVLRVDRIRVGSTVAILSLCGVALSVCRASEFARAK